MRGTGMRMNRFISAAEWLTDKYILLMLLVFPLFVGFDGYVNITLSKYVFFTAATAVWLCGTAVLTILARRRPAMCAWKWAALGFAVWAALSAFRSPYFPETLIGASRYDGLLTILLYVGILFGVAAYGKMSRRYVWALLLSSSICCAVALLQLCGVPILYPHDYTYYDGGVKYVGKFLGTIGNTNLLASFLCMSAGLLAAWYAADEKRRDIMAASAAFAVSIIVGSLSRGGMLALIVSVTMALLLFSADCTPMLLRSLSALTLGAAVAGFFVLPPGITFVITVAIWLLMFLSGVFERHIPREQHRGTVVVTLVVTGLGVLLVVYFWPLRSGTIYEISRVLHGDIRGEFGSSRIQIWQACLELVKDSPIWGGGPGTLALRLDLEFSRYFEELGRMMTSRTDNAHNVYLGYLVDIGLPGLLFYLTLIAVSLARIIKSRSWQVRAVGCALAAAWTEGMFGLGLCLTAPVMWVLWGLMFSMDAKAVDLPWTEKNS